MATGRTLHAELDLLDRQLRDRDGRLCGNVDDLELSRAESGELYVTALLSGPGTLLRRLGAGRLGGWLERFRRETGAPAGGAEAADQGRIPMALVHQIGPAIDLAVSADELASSQSERWVREHVIDHIPGSKRNENQ
jgi:hypothetical protein